MRRHRWPRSSPARTSGCSRSRTLSSRSPRGAAWLASMRSSGARAIRAPTSAARWAHMNGLTIDRLVAITDEQSHDYVPQPQGGPAYMINIASNKNGVGYGRWTHIDGFSENVIRFMQKFEADTP